jgi:hypothetical protein
VRPEATVNGGSHWGSPSRCSRGLPPLHFAAHADPPVTDEGTGGLLRQPGSSRAEPGERLTPVRLRSVPAWCDPQNAGLGLDHQGVFLLDEFLLRAQTGCGADLAPNLLRSSPAGPLVGGKGEDILGSLSRSPCGSGAIAGGGRRRSEDLMTQNKDFKRLVRARALKTGESYAAAFHQLRSTTDAGAPDDPIVWRRIERAEYAYAIHIPERWDEFPPDLRNSPWETARYSEKGDRRRGAIVFRNPDMPGRDARQVAEVTCQCLEATGYGNFGLQDTMLGDMPAARLDCDKRDAGRIWAVREYIVVLGAVYLNFGMGTATPEDDRALIDAMAERFEVLR